MHTATLAIALFALVAPLAQDAPRPKQRAFFGAQFLQEDNGIKIGQVVPDSPAQKAGLAGGDVIVKLNGEAVTTVAAFIKSMHAAGAGAELKIELVDGRELKVTLARHPQEILEEPDTAPGLLKVRREFDLAYHTGERHKLNLVLPETDKPFPTVMWIHAGAWSMGGRENETALGVRLAERGIGFAAISHRLSSRAWLDPKAPKEGAKHPDHVEDCARAFAWLRANIKARGGDPTLIFVSGHSSGGHLAALLATDERYLKALDVPITAIRGAIPVGGGYDIPKYHAYLAKGWDGDADAHCESIFGPKEGWVAASPATYAKDAKVPMLVITEDDPAFQAYTADFKAAVPEGSPIEFWTAKDRVHQTITAKMSQKGADEPREKMIEFVRSKSDQR